MKLNKTLFALVTLSASAAFGMQQADNQLIKELAHGETAQKAAKNFKALACTNKALKKFVYKNSDSIAQELSKNFNIPEEQAYDLLWKKSALETLPAEVKELIIASLVQHPDPIDPTTLKKSRQNLVNLLSSCKSFRDFNTPINLKTTIDRIAHHYTADNILAAALVLSIPGSRPHFNKKTTEEFQVARAYAGRAFLLHCNDYQKGLNFLKKVEKIDRLFDTTKPKTRENTIGFFATDYILKTLNKGIGAYPYSTDTNWPPKEWTQSHIQSLKNCPNPILANHANKVWQAHVITGLSFSKIGKIYEKFYAHEHQH